MVEGRKDSRLAKSVDSASLIKEETHMSAHLHHLDPRLKILAGVVLGVLTWQAGPPGLLLYGASILFVLWGLGQSGSLSPMMIRVPVLAVLGWVVLKLILSLLSKEPLWPDAFQESALLGGRLAILIGTGLALTASTSTRQVGLAVNSLLRPVLGRRAWVGSLGLALMLNFLPITLRTMEHVRQAVMLRCGHLRVWTRYSLMISGVTRSLGRKTWEQALGLAARGLDHEEAWQERLPFRLREWLGGLSALGLAAVSAWV
jgi:energy-coupling factor transporter transmembrane protein EcfT